MRMTRLRMEKRVVVMMMIRMKMRVRVMTLRHLIVRIVKLSKVLRRALGLI